MSRRDFVDVFDASDRLDTAAVVVAIAAALYVTVGMVWLLPSPGSTPLRLGLLVVTVAIAWTGAIGVLVDRPVLPLSAALVLFLLGFWQAVLWVFMVPAGLGLAVAGVVVTHSP